jgi:hypothetical protein
MTRQIAVMSNESANALKLKTQLAIQLTQTALKPCRFAFKVEPDRRIDGFIAHEMAEVVPEAVTGVKDGTNEEGQPVYQAVDAARLIPILVSAVQELARRVAVLEARA